MAAKSRLLRAATVTGLILTAAVALAPGAVAAPSPAAASAGSLSFTPSSGADTTPMFLVTPKACPTAATNVVANALGHGFPASGQPVLGNTTAGISHTAPFVMPLQDSFNGLAAVNGATLMGPYQITFRCTDSLGIKTFAAFTGTVTFSDAHHFTAPAVPNAIAAQIVASQNQEAGPAPSAAAPSADGSAPHAVRSPSASAVRHSSSSWQPWLVLVAVLLIGMAVVMRARELRRDRHREAAKAAHVARAPRDAKADSSADLTSVD